VSTTSSRESQQQSGTRSNGSGDAEAAELGTPDDEFDPNATKVDLVKPVDGVDAEEPAAELPADQYPVQGRGGKGVLTAKIVQNRGRLVGALMVRPEDEVFAMTSSGGVIRTSAGEIKQSGRQTMGVRLVNLTEGDVVVAIARNVESIEAIEAVTDTELPDDVVLDTEVLDAEVLDSEGPTDVEPGEEGSERS